MSRAAPRPDPDSLKAHFAYELRRLRAKAELSQQQLATALGCTPQWIWQLENCEKTVSLQTARDLDVHFETEGRETDDGLFHRLYRSIKKAELSRVLLPGFASYLEFEQRANILQLTERAGLVADGRVRFNSLMGEALSQAESVTMMTCKREEYL